MSRLSIAFVLAAAGLSSAASLGCASRKAAATQTTITAFDPAGSEPRAVEIADQVLAALGGQAAWDQAKEISWTQGIVVDGKLVDHTFHAWDRWNGRHHMTRLDPRNGQRGIIMHDLFEELKFAYVHGEGGRAKQMKDITEDMAAEGTKRLALDGYRLLLPFKLKDPGVHLKFSEERPADGVTEADAPMKLDVIQITFDPGVGPAAGDVWYLVVDKETHMPVQVEHVPTGRSDQERSATKLEDFVESGGLKFATKYTNIGYTKPDAPKVQLQIPPVWAEMSAFRPMEVPSPGELVLIAGVKVAAEVNEDLFVPDVTLDVK